MKFKSNIFLFVCATFLLLLVITSVNGQTINEKYRSESIYLQGNKYVKNGMTHRIGFMGRNLKNEMTISPNAVFEFNKYQQKRKTGILLYTAGLAVIGSGFLIYNESVRSGLIIGGLALSIISIPVAKRSEKHFQKAIWIRNGDILY